MNDLFETYGLVIVEVLSSGLLCHILMNVLKVVCDLAL